jgi:hypothetical protein
VTYSDFGSFDRDNDSVFPGCIRKHRFDQGIKESLQKVVENYADRNGYPPDFLGDSSDFLVQLPLPKDKSDLVQVERARKERPFELQYRNFSVVMGRSRRFCCITGVNIPLLPDH